MKRPKLKTGRKPDGVARTKLNLSIHQSAADNFRKLAIDRRLTQADLFNSTFNPA
jgi:hypothetical protein